MSLLITCEAGGENVPTWLQPRLVANDADASDIARSLPQPRDCSAKNSMDWQERLAVSSDRAGLYAATSMAGQLRADLIVNEYSNVLVDVARSLRHRQLFSKLSRSWPKVERENLVECVYRPYRDRVRGAVQAQLSARGIVVHLSIRSFNLRSRGKIRRTDVGLLYDPSRRDDVDFCLDWIDEMWDRVPMLRVRRNYPHRGATDGLIGSLRKEFAGQGYLGVDVWLNRAWAQRDIVIRDKAISGICTSLQAVIGDESLSDTRAA